MTSGLKRSGSRLFLIEDGAGPSHVPEYQGQTVAQAPEQSFGTPTIKKRPSRTQRDGFDRFLTIEGEEEDPTLDLSGYYPDTASELLRLARKKCIIDVQIHHGRCKDPQDFDNGWVDSKIVVLEDARFSNWSTDEQGVLEPGDNDTILEEASLVGTELYEVLPMNYTSKAASEVAQEIVKILVCDVAACGDCEDPTDGCQKVFAISAPAGSSPGVLPEVIYSSDALTTVGETPIDTLAIGEDPDDAACVGEYLVVVSEDSESLHYADKDDILDGTETWTEVATGFVASSGPRAIDSISPRHTWMGGAGGYIYFSNNILSGVTTVQDAGSATTEDINDVNMWSSEVGTMVADNNVVLITTNGSDWSNKTGPEPAANLLAVAHRQEKEIWVGTSTGNLYYSKDRGDSWTQSAFSGDGTGSVLAVVWATKTVGWISHQTALTKGILHRTVSGGNTWKQAPDSTGTVPVSDKINSLAVCYRQANKIFAGGLADNAADGILLKGTD